MENTILQTIKSAFNKRSITVAPTSSLGIPYGMPGTPLAVDTALQLSTVYRCVEVIGDAIASQTWQVLDFKGNGWVNNEFDPVAYMLNTEPSRLMSRFTMMKTLMAKVLLRGDGLLHIKRASSGDPVALELCNDDFKMFVDEQDNVIYTIVREGKEDITLRGEDVIHVINHTYNGLRGISTLHHANLSMGLAQKSEATATGFFTSGANMSGMLRVKGKLTPEKATAIKDSFAQAFDYTSGNPGGIAVVEEGIDFQGITINPKDAQMLETRQFNVVEICRFFGVNPSKVFDNNNLTYSNIESFQLGFLTDTIAPLNAKIEAEFNRKLLRPSKRIKTRLNLDMNDLYRANLDTKANYVSKMFQAGGYTINEVRKEAGNPPVQGGDQAYYQVNMQPVGTKAEPKIKDKPIITE